MPPDKLLDTASTLDTTKTKETVSPPEFFEGEKEINQQYESFFDEAVILGEFESSEIKAKLQQFLQAPENEELKRRLKTSLKRKKDDKEAFNKVIKCFIVDNMI
ncbi:MAG: hypothetical protein LBP53_06185 [Candidatus Peribacteria bacterium]|jgi:hypothetical protein|nr:hypothetical protein [Candidatus Peribacteria bacterium]